jgi:hypothetical protein
MFDPKWVDTGTDPQPPMSKIAVHLSVAYATWADCYPDSSDSTVVWKRATLRYDYHFYAGDDEYIVGIDPQAEFTCRPVQVNGKEEWRLIEWHDLGFNNATTQSNSGAVVKRSWGKIKSLYHVESPEADPGKGD